MSAIRYTPRAADMPNPNRGQGGSYTEIEVPGDYEVKLESYKNYDNTAKEGGTKGWVFTYSCETPSGGSVPFTVYLPFSQMWKIILHFTALGSVVTEDEGRDFDPEELLNSVTAAHIDFPRDQLNNPTSKYREIRYVFPIPQDSDIVEIIEASTPEVVELPDEVEEL
jgi:hypothetical protein